MERRMDWEKMEDKQILEVIRPLPDLIRQVEEQARLMKWQLEYIMGKIGGIEELRRRHGKRDKV